MTPHGSKNLGYTLSLPYETGQAEPSFYVLSHGPKPVVLSDCMSFSTSKRSSGVGHTIPSALNFLSLAKSYSPSKLQRTAQLFWESFLHFSLFPYSILYTSSLKAFVMQYYWNCCVPASMSHWNLGFLRAITVSL